MGISKCPKGTEIVDGWLTTVESFERSLTSQCQRWEDIPDMCRVEDGPTPERMWKAAEMMATECTSDERLVTTLSNTILLRGIRHGGFMLNAAFSKVAGKIMGNVFTTIVTVEMLDTATRLRLDPRQKMFERVQSVGLAVHEVDQGIPGVVISEHNKI